MEAVRTAEGHQLAIRIVRLRSDDSPFLTTVGGSVSKGGSPSMPAEAPFGTVHLGERFASLLLLSNEGVSRLHGITIKIELQTSSQRALLHHEVTPLATPTELEAGQQVSLRTLHDIRELGVHVLICSVHYECGVTAERKFLRKFFKFTVINPLTLKTKISELPGQLLLEAQLHNVAGSRFVLESVAFVLASEQQQGQGLLCETIEESLLSPMERLSLGEGTRKAARYESQLLDPESIYQYVFILKPALSILGGDVNLFNKQQALVLGRLDIQWRTAEGGECGRLQTGILTHHWDDGSNEGGIATSTSTTRSTPALSSTQLAPAAISIALGACPSRTPLQQPFDLSIILRNDTDKTLSDVRIIWDHPTLVLRQEGGAELLRSQPPTGALHDPIANQHGSRVSLSRRPSPSPPDPPAFAPIGPPVLYLGTLTAFNSTRTRMKIMPLLPGLQESKYFCVQYVVEEQRVSDEEIESTPEKRTIVTAMRKVPIHFTIFIESLTVQK